MDPETQPSPVRRPRSRSVRWLRRISWVLMGTAMLIAGYVGVLVGYQSYQQHRLASAWNQDHPAATIADATLANSGSAVTVRLRPHLADGQPVGRLTIPKINFEAIVTEGADSGILSGGPGHDDRTGYPGEGRVVAIGNHNGFSMSWNDVGKGDEVVLEMAYGRYHYTVTQRYIVDGGDTTVLSKDRPQETLVLSTCWPLWAGAFAHQRLVFEAVPQGAQS